MFSVWFASLIFAVSVSSTFAAAKFVGAERDSHRTSSGMGKD
jgi:hypothetical protein